MSKQAIDKRFNIRTKNMLTAILQKALSKQMKLDFQPNQNSNFFSQIRVMDSSEFVVSKKVSGTYPGYGGKGREAIVQVQFEYEMLSGQVTQLTLGSSLDADITEGMQYIDKVPSQALLIRDLGYFTPKIFKELSKRNIYFISRAKSQWNYYIIQDNIPELVTTQDLINKLKNQKEKYLDIEVIAGAGARTKVRLIANMLSEDQTANRLKKKKDKLGKLGKDILEGACINLFVTNIEVEKCDASSIYELYTMRWQIELIFKTWKSILKIQKMHSMNATRLECILLVKLLWIMLNWSVLLVLKAKTKIDISLHKFTHTMMSRSKILTIKILQCKDLLYEWINEMSKISIKHHVKEYKKGSVKLPEIFFKTFYKTA